MAKIIAVANQKGGVGKTTTTVNLSACIAQQGKRVLCVDIDPQGNSTSGLGIDKEAVQYSVYDVLINGVDPKEAIEHSLDMLTARKELSGAEVELVNAMARETVLKRELDTIRDSYDYIFIDCPPSLGLLTINALTAADTLLAPIQCEYFALEGLSDLMNTVKLVKQRLNTDLQVEGVVLTMFDARTNLSGQVVNEVKKFFKNMAIKKGLGKGLDALLGDYQQPPEESVKEIDVNLIDTNSSQPRKSFDKEKLDELANSIKNHGIVQPIVVRRTGERYTIVAGERRYRAARIAGLNKVPVVVKDMDDYQVMEVALIENIQREDLNPIEEATAIRFLMVQNDLTQEEVAERLAKSRPSIANTLRLLNLPEEIQQYLKDGKLQSGHAKVILSLPEKPMQFRLADRIAEGGVSVREAERLAKAMLQPGREKKKPEQPADTDLKFAEDRLRDRLGTKVSIQGSQSKGKVIIEYYSRDELNGIYDILIRE